MNCGSVGGLQLFRFASFESRRQGSVLLADRLQTRRLVQGDAPSTSQRRPGRRLIVHRDRCRARRRRPGRELAGRRSRHGAHRLAHLSRQPRTPAATAARPARPERRRRQRRRGRQRQPAAVPARLPRLVGRRRRPRPQRLTDPVQQRRRRRRGGRQSLADLTRAALQQRPDGVETRVRQPDPGLQTALAVGRISVQADAQERHFEPPGVRQPSVAPVLPHSDPARRRAGRVELGASTVNRNAWCRLRAGGTADRQLAARIRLLFRLVVGRRTDRREVVAAGLSLTTIHSADEPVFFTTCSPEVDVPNELHVSSSRQLGNGNNQHFYEQ